MAAPTIYIVGTCDTKHRELVFLKEIIGREGLAVRLVDLSTTTPVPGHPDIDVQAISVASRHPGGPGAVFTGDRGSAVAAMSVAFERYLLEQTDVAGVLGIGGSGGTALISPALQKLPVGTPKIVVSTVASSDVSRYVGPADIMLMYSVADLAGLNRITRPILENAALAMAGMASRKRASDPHALKEAIGLSMFGVTTPCVEQVSAQLKDDFDYLVFHATGTGGQSMMKLAGTGLLSAVLDVTTTEVADLLVGGIFPAKTDRFDAVADTLVPYVGSCGALDMVNFGPRESVPAHFHSRRLYAHNAAITLMRTTPEENASMGRWIGEQLNRCEGEVSFLLPEGGVSALDAPGRPFHDPDANAALFSALEKTVNRTDRRRITRLPYHINDAAFASALVEHFHSVVPRNVYAPH